MDAEGESSPRNRPLRTCVGCRRRHPKRCLVRFAVQQKAIVVDARQRLPGRGAYLCDRQRCAARVLADGRRLARALRATDNHVTIDGPALYDEWNTVRSRHGHHHAGRASQQHTQRNPTADVASTTARRPRSAGDGT